MWHAACGTVAHGRAAHWSEHHRTGRVVRSSTQRRQIALIWTTAQSMPPGLTPAHIGASEAHPEEALVDVGVDGVDM